MNEYEYTIYRGNSRNVFKVLCKKIEELFPYHYKEHMLMDVDGTTIQKYLVDGAVLCLYDDYAEQGVYIKSDMDLEQYLKDICAECGGD